MTSDLALYENEINLLIKQYLSFAGLEKATNSLHLECNEKGKPIPAGDKVQADGSKLTAQNNILLEFDGGHHNGFWQLWEENVPGDIRSKDQTCQRLEFYIQIHFAVYPIRVGTAQSGSANVERSMTSFKQFLENKGSELSQTTEFLPFYALPFVPNPVQHPSFKELFSTYWIPDLRARVDRFLSAALSASEPPLLITLFKNRGRLSVAEDASEQATKTLQQHLIQAERRCSAYMKRFNKLQADYHTLISITAELVDSLEQTVHGRMVTAEYLQKVCARLFNSRAVGASVSAASVDFTRPGTASSILRASIVQDSFSHEKEETPLLPSLDYNKIKLHLRDGSDRTKALLLQALRWRLTRSMPGDQRDTVLLAYIDNDLLGCRPDLSVNTNLASGSHMLTLFECNDVAVRQYAARLYNAMASLQQGRAYFCFKPNEVGRLQKFLWRNRGFGGDKSATDHIFEEHLLGCLQKLSLRRPLQTIMIQGDLIRWLVTILSEHDSLSDYMLEYAVALLMNLCLRSSGKLRCGQDAGLVLKVLSELLGHDNVEIRPYVNGALYSVLSNAEVRQEAHAIGLETVLRDFMEGEQEEFKRQLDFIIKQLNKTEIEDDALDESDDEGDEDDDEDQDAMEADLDKDEIVVARPNELFGEQLLCSEYLGILTNTRGAYQQTNRHRAVDTLAVASSIPMRPTTPSHHRLSTSFQDVGSSLQSQSLNFNPDLREPTSLQSSTNTLIASSQWQGLSAPNPSGSRPVSRPSSRSLASVKRSSRPPTADNDARQSSQHTSRSISSRTGGIDQEGSTLVTQLTGVDRLITLPASNNLLLPAGKEGTSEAKEYISAFSSRPRITRTPEVGTRSAMSSRNATLSPTFSVGEPTSRPSTGQSWRSLKGSSGSLGDGKTRRTK